jgi:multidrug resistance protein, MATE family
MAVVGHLPGAHYLGGVAVAALIFSIIYATMNFLRMGTTGLTAQALGARDGVEVRAWLARAALISIVIGLILVTFQTPISLLALDMIAPSEAVRPLSQSYFSIRIWGAPAALLNFAILGWFFGIQNTRAALITQLFMNGVNIILDVWFVMGLGWGVEGVATATLISEVSAVGLGLWLVRRNAKGLAGHWQLKSAFDRQRLIAMFRVNRDIFLRSICLQASFAILTSLGARHGDVILAVNAILLNILAFVAYGLDGFANAAESLAGEAYGARNLKTFRAAVLASTRWAGILSVFLTLSLFAGGSYIIDALSGVEEVQRVARVYLPWAAIMPIVSVWCFQLDGIFIGTTHTAEMRNGMALSLVVYLLMLYILIPIWGNHGAWLAMALFMATRGLTLGLMYPRIERAITNHT